MFKLDLEKAEEPRIKLPTSARSWRKQGNSRKTSTSASLTMLKPLTVCITQRCGKFLKRWEYWTALPVFWETCMQVKKKQVERDMKQQTGSKLGKVYIKAVSCHCGHLTYMQSAWCKMSGWMNYKLESRCWEKHQYHQICRWHHLNGRKQRRTKEPIDGDETGEWKSWLKTQHS